jgi:simple sugar transport system ATP-binding protein
MRGIVKTFGRFRALENVDFTLRKGEVHALLGENGAGKSTLIKVMTGALMPDEGEIRLAGQPVTLRSPHAAQELGIACVYQEVNLLPNLSVAENVMLGRIPMKMGRIDWAETRRRAVEALKVLDLDIDVRLPLQSYSIAVQQLVAIARSVAIQAKVVVLDEPTSSLDEAEVNQLFNVIRRLRADGIGIVFITHFLDQVDAVADRITILRNGKLIGEFVPDSLSRVQLISKMVGKELGALTDHAAAGEDKTGEPIIEGTALNRKRIGPVDVQVRRGEIVGLAGLLGSGRTETARMLFGLDRPDKGTIKFLGREVQLKSPKRAMRLGIGLIPEDRKHEAIIPGLSIRENIVLALQAKQGWLKRIPRAKQEELARQYREALGIATDSIEKPIGQLSGGNQQKVILGRWLATEPQFLILDEPTRGIDVGARDDIEKLIATLCEGGIGVLMISSEIDELLRCSDRLIVMRNGQAVGQLPRGSASDQVMHMIAGGA